MNNTLSIRWMGALCVLLAACSTDSNRMSSTDSSSMQDRSTSSSYDNPSSTSSTSTTGSMNNSSNTAGTSSTTTTTTVAQTSYGVVQAIDQVMRQDVGVGAVGAAAAGGTVGSPTDKVYRVKLKLDDGTEQSIVLDTMPTYRVGDRVRYSNGTVQRY
ncbi:hypothetical protein [Rugamonas apoptosis]|uniref:Lipoprotein n=1 Tax=Rugamonas apoptosis TaxID=2758570 RepID=A0A7W2IM75_9BURK|nr:hypothetical protein [Rugamonas apoptosis]MBA5689520.1 hypothetical protein [Rugamonas apoptosis]